MMKSGDKSPHSKGFAISIRLCKGNPLDALSIRALLFDERDEALQHRAALLPNGCGIRRFVARFIAIFCVSLFAVYGFSLRAVCGFSRGAVRVLFGVEVFVRSLIAIFFGERLHFFIMR